MNNNDLYKEKNIKKGSKEYNKILEILLNSNLSPEDAADIVIISGDDNKSILRAVKLLNDDFKISAYNVSRLIQQGISDNDIILLQNSKSFSENALFEILDNEKQKAIKDIFDLLKLEDEKIYFYDAYEMCKSIDFDSIRLQDAIKLKQDVANKHFKMKEALRISEYQKDYLTKEIKEACEICDKNPQALFYFSVEEIVGLIRRDNDKFNQIINFASENDIELFYDTYNAISANGLCCAKEALVFVNRYNVPFEEGLSFVINHKVPKETAVDDVFPKELTDKELIEKYESNTPWEEIAEDMYSQIRRCGKYAISYGDDNYSGNYGDLYSIINWENDVEVDYGYWSTRATNIANLFQPAERISLNVKGDAKLIEELDNLMLQTKDMFVYKVFASPSLWETREDPITFYFKEDITPETFDIIAKMTESYKRGRINSEPKDSKTPWIKK